MKLQDKIKKLEKQVRRYKRLSLIDDLTQINNHRKLKQDLERYLELQKRHKVKFIVALFDIDNFKLINDKEGHIFGDKILKKTAKILRNNIRKYEKVYRLYNGDEFILILSHTSNHKKIIKRIKSQLKNYDISVSVGYSKLKNNVLEIIDRQMYKQKQRKKYNV